MKFAPVLPPELYYKLDTGDYHLVQAHTISQNRRAMDWFRDRISFGHTVILDNGVCELGEPDLFALTIAAATVRPSIVVAPDAFGDQSGTISSLRISAQQMLKLAPSVMVVLHGKTIDEAAQGFHDINSFWKHRGYCFDRLCFGIPKILDAAILHGRWHLLKYLIHTIGASPRRFHLLGINCDLKELDPILRDFPSLMGCDSTWPCAEGLHCRDMSQWEQITSKYALTPSDWYITEADLSIEQFQTIKSNIKFCRGYIDE